LNVLDVFSEVVKGVVGLNKEVFGADVHIKGWLGVHFFCVHFLSVSMFGVG